MEILACSKNSEANLQKLFEQTNQVFERIKVLKQTHKNDEKSYCNMLSPKYSNVLQNYQLFTQTSILR